MKIKVTTKKWASTANQRAFKKLADHAMSHYPKDSALHKAVRAAFKAMDEAAGKLGKGAKKPTARRKPVRKVARKRVVRRVRRAVKPARRKAAAPKRAARRVVRRASPKRGRVVRAAGARRAAPRRSPAKRRMRRAA